MTYAQLLADQPPEALCLLAYCSLRPQEDFAARLGCYQHCNSKAAELLGKMQDEVPENLQQGFCYALKCWRQGAPLAYILGVEDFAGRSFAVGPGALVPRADSEILLQQALALWGPNRGPVLELCCGTACISLCLEAGLEKQQPDLWASDISPEALAYARKNRDWYQATLQLRSSDLFCHPELQQPYQLILANPPYLSRAECRKRSSWQEPILALDGGEDGLAVLRRIIDESRNYLIPSGVLLLEAAPWQIHELGRLLCAGGYEQLAVHRDSAGWERVISARYWPRNSICPCRLA